jgi:DNA/RNA-binding domain of Phe-tRNA-synthetase-like protein
MRLTITDEIFEDYPDAIIGVATGRGLDNSGDPPEVGEKLREAGRSAARVLGETPPGEHPRVAPWRQAYRRFGADPKKHSSSIESLLRRTRKGEPLPRVHPLVDLYNVVSLRHLVPVGGEDLDRVSGDLLLTKAGAQEPAVLLLGDREPRAPHPGEVVYCDSSGAVCRRWNWREADRTKLTRQTRNAVFVAEGLPPVGRPIIAAAISDLAGLLQEFCGGQITTAVLDRETRSVELS